MPNKVTQEVRHWIMDWQVFQQQHYFYFLDIIVDYVTIPGIFPWQAGEQVHVSWSITANHGGGYQYRLCPDGQDLTEECFQKMPLDFVGQQEFLWADGTSFLFNGTYVTEGTIPKGSKWAMNPVPRNDTVQTGKSFPPRCKEIPNCGSTEVNSKCKCSGMWGPYDMQIVDTLQVNIIFGFKSWIQESNSQKNKL